MPLEFAVNFKFVIEKQDLLLVYCGITINFAQNHPLFPFGTVNNITITWLFIRLAILKNSIGLAIFNEFSKKIIPLCDTLNV